MQKDVGLIGFGEAGSTFALAGAWERSALVFDVKAQHPGTRTDMIAAYTRAKVQEVADLEALAYGTSLILSLVTADQALPVAEAAAKVIAPGALYCDFNSVAPQTKQAAARTIESAGGQYVDVAVLAPVDPARLAVPLLLSGTRADDARDRLAALGFVNQRVVGPKVGRASSIKMIRSVIVKGIEALTAECALAADAAGVLDEVLASLDASEKARPWGERADYNLDRMMVHGLRRAAEMEEVVKTLEGLGTGAAMTRGTVERQRAIGMLGAMVPPEGLVGKIGLLTGRHFRESGNPSPELAYTDSVGDGSPPPRG